MADCILVDGDTVNFVATFGAAMVNVKPGKLKGSGLFTIGGKKVCVSGDEADVKVKPCLYNMPPFSGGMGTLTIATLASDQTAKKPCTGSKPVLLKGSQFVAKFTVDTPATAPPGTVPPTDPMPVYMGMGTFTPAKTTIKGT